MRLLCFSVDTDPDQKTWFTGSWGWTPTSQSLLGPQKWEDFLQSLEKKRGLGWLLKRIQVFAAADGSLQAVGLLEEGSDVNVGLYSSNSWGDCRRYCDDKNRQAWASLLDFQTYLQGNGRSYFGIWRAKQFEDCLITPQRPGDFWSSMNSMQAQGYQLKEVVRVPNLPTASQPKWAEVIDQGLAGLGKGCYYIAMRDGLVTSQGGGGEMRAPQDGSVPFGPYSRMTLASVSKPRRLSLGNKCLKRFGEIPSGYLW